MIPEYAICICSLLDLEQKKTVEVSFPGAKNSHTFLKLYCSNLASNKTFNNLPFSPSVVSLTSCTTGQSFVMSRKVISHLYSPSSEGRTSRSHRRASVLESSIWRSALLEFEFFVD